MLHDHAQLGGAGALHDVVQGHGMHLSRAAQRHQQHTGHRTWVQAAEEPPAYRAALAAVHAAPSHARTHLQVSKARQPCAAADWLVRLAAAQHHQAALLHHRQRLWVVGRPAHIPHILQGKGGGLREAWVAAVWAPFRRCHELRPPHSLAPQHSHTLRSMPSGAPLSPPLAGAARSSTLSTPAKSTTASLLASQLSSSRAGLLRTAHCHSAVRPGRTKACTSPLPRATSSSCLCAVMAQMGSLLLPC